MADSTELEELTKESDDDTDLVRNLRKALKGQGRELKELRSSAEEALAKVQGFEAEKVFDAVGIPKDGAGKLFRDTFKGDLDADAVRSAAQEYGLIEAPKPEAGAEEQAAHAAIEDVSGSAPPAPPTLEDQIRELDPNDPHGMEKLMKALDGSQIKVDDSVI